MNKRPEQRQLLDDVLAESASPDFRTALLGETLRLARHRRRWLLARQAGGSLVVMLLAGWLVWPRGPEPSIAVVPVAKTSAPTSFLLIQTQPFPAGAMVSTMNFTGVGGVASEPSVTVVATTSGGFLFINDEQLLALLGDRPAILIRIGPDKEELVFANPEDQKLLSPR